MADFEGLFDSSQSFVTRAVNHIPPMHTCLRANGQVVVGIRIGASSAWTRTPSQVQYNNNNNNGLKYGGFRKARWCVLYSIYVTVL